MEVYRIASSQYSADISGYGAQLHGGRYNPVGIPALYTAAHISLACLEVLVHANSTFSSIKYSLITIDIPEDSILKYQLEDMPDDWTKPIQVDNPLAIGVAWLLEYNFLTLKVPSVVVPYENNLIINPRHPKFSEVKIVSVKDFQFDRRLFAL